jgi:chromosome segregation ATPase
LSRLEEIEERGEGQKSQLEALTRAAREHEVNACQLQALSEQLGRIRETLTSDTLEQTEAEVAHSRSLLDQERHRLAQSQRELLQDNLDLTQRCDRALEKVRKNLSGNWLATGLKNEALRIGLGILQEPLKFISDTGLVPEPSTDWLDRHLQGVTDAVQQHADRLEKTQKQLLDTRTLLEGIALD